MSKTEIEWCKRPGTKPETWNPTTGCNKVSQGCKHCYAEVMHRRLQVMYPKKYSQPFLDGAVEHEEALMIPYFWKHPRTVFVNSMSDLFHDNISTAFIARVWQVMKDLPQHTFQILTKRHSRMATIVNELIQSGAFEVLPNVWLGVSIEDQQTANSRLPFLNLIPAAVKFVSMEPLLGPVDFEQALGETLKWHAGGLKNCISWVITGGESGHGARPVHPDWIRSIRDQCKAANIPFFFKQWGEWKPYHTNPVVEPIPLSCFSKKKMYYRDGRFQPIPGSEGVDTAMKDFVVFKVGKDKSGRKLDGMEHNAFPVNSGA